MINDDGFIEIEGGDGERVADPLEAISKNTSKILDLLQKGAVSNPNGAVLPNAFSGKVTMPKELRDRSGIALPKRDEKGRFIPSAKQDKASDKDAEKKGQGFMSRMVGKLTDAIKNKAGGVAGIDGVEQIDPAFMAAKEMRDMVSPLTGVVSSFGGMFGDSEKKREAKEEAKANEKIQKPWFRRIDRKLNIIAGKKTGGAGGSLVLGRLLKLLGMILLPLAALKIGFKALSSGVGVAAKGIASLVGGVGGLGALSKLAGKLFLPLTAMVSAVKSFNTSTEEYAARMGVELDGSLAQELGVRFVGVLGDLGNTLTFGLAGKFGEWLSNNVPNPFEMADKAITATSDAASGAWHSTKALFTGTHSGNEAHFEAATKGMKPLEKKAFLESMHKKTNGYRDFSDGIAPADAAHIEAMNWRRTRADSAVMLTVPPALDTNGIRQNTSAAIKPISPVKASAQISPKIYQSPEVPNVQTRLNSQKPVVPKVEVSIPSNLTQNLSDREIAHLATGGMGSGLKGD